MKFVVYPINHCSKIRLLGVSGSLYLLQRCRSFQHVGCYFPGLCYVAEIDMLHGSTILSIYFFNLRQILTNIMIVMQLRD